MHELAHAMAASAIGATVWRIKLGTTQNPIGPHLSFGFIGFPWELYSVPITGSVSVFLTNPHHYRWRAVAMSAAGPLMSLLLASMGLLYFILPLGLFERAALFGWTLANAYLFFGTIIPFKISYRGRPQINDGINILRHLRLTGDVIRERCQTASFQLLFFEAGKTVKNLSLDEVLDRHKADPMNTGIAAQAVAKAIDVGSSLRFPMILKLARDPAFPRKRAAHLLDSIITGALINNRLEPAEFYEEASSLLLEASDGTMTAKGTRGCVLILLSRFTEGRSMLEAVVSQSKEKIDQGYSHVVLAFAAKAEGSLELARKHARQAAVYPSCPALELIPDLLES